jgi:hypothetical protein
MAENICVWVELCIDMSLFLKAVFIIFSVLLPTYLSIFEVMKSLEYRQWYFIMMQHLSDMIYLYMVMGRVCSTHWKCIQNFRYKSWWGEDISKDVGLDMRIILT